MKSIRFCIDDVKSNEEKSELIISGWAYDEKNRKVEIELLDEKIIEKKTVERYDIYHHFNEAENSLNSGFLITAPYKEKMKLKFFTDDEEIICKIKSNGNYNTNTSKGTVSRILNIVHPKNIFKLFKQMKEYGIIYTLRKLKHMFFPHKIKSIEYKDWVIKNRLRESELKEQLKHKFNDQIKLSLIILIKENEVELLSSTLESIKKQTYKNVELSFVNTCLENEDKIINIIEPYKEYMVLGEIKQNINEAIKSINGDYVATVFSGDMLAPNALYEITNYVNEYGRKEFIYSDEDAIDVSGRNFSNPHFKPDWSPDMLNSYNYIGHLAFIKKEIINITEEIRNEYELYLRVSEVTSNIGHISKVLYHNRVLEKDYILRVDDLELNKSIIQEHLNRTNVNGKVKYGLIEGTYKVDYEIEDNPLVSIIIPNKDETETLKKCIDSIIEKSTYINYEIIIVENNSTSSEIFEYYDEIEKLEKVKVIKWEKGFNYSAINNFAFKHTKGEFIVLLNNDIEVITPNWIEEMLMYTQRNDVGITGAKLYYPDDSIQHAGVIIGLNSVAGHSHGRFERDDNGYAGRLKVVQNLSAVTAACLMIKRSTFEEINGLDEKYPVAFNDVDFCLRVIEKGNLIVFNPYVEMYHYESKSRGIEDSPEKVKRFNGEVKRFKEKWGLWRRDPYYNENLTREEEDFSLRI